MQKGWRPAVYAFFQVGVEGLVKASPGLISVAVSCHILCHCGVGAVPTHCRVCSSITAPCSLSASSYLLPEVTLKMSPDLARCLPALSPPGWQPLLCDAWAETTGGRASGQELCWRPGCWRECGQDTEPGWLFLSFSDTSGQGSASRPSGTGPCDCPPHPALLSLSSQPLSPCLHPRSSVYYLPSPLKRERPESRVVCFYLVL